MLPSNIGLTITLVLTITLASRISCQRECAVVGLKSCVYLAEYEASSD